jgi:hypothetical protein
MSEAGSLFRGKLKLGALNVLGQMSSICTILEWLTWCQRPELGHDEVGVCPHRSPSSPFGKSVPVHAAAACVACLVTGSAAVAIFDYKMVPLSSPGSQLFLS